MTTRVMVDAHLRVGNFYWADKQFLPSLQRDDGSLDGDLLRRVRGPFAFALPASDGRLTLVRDRLGLNKLFFAVHESGRVAVANYLIDLVNDGVPFEAIYSVPAGHALELDVARHAFALHRYFDIGTTTAQDEASLEAVAKCVGEQLDLWFSRIAAQLGGRRVCVCLSGGLDSSVIAVWAKRYVPDVVAYTYGWSDGGAPTSEDVRAATRVAQSLGIPLRVVPASSRDLLDVLDDAICYGQDWRDFNVHCAVVNEILARAIERDATECGDAGRPLVLTGDLMNEFVADYTPVSFAGHEYYRLPKLPPGALRSALVRGLDAGDREVGIFNHHGIDVLQPYGMMVDEYLRLPPSLIGPERAKADLARALAGDVLPAFLFRREKVRAQIGNSDTPTGVVPVLSRAGRDARWLRRAFCRVFGIREEGFLDSFIRVGRYRFPSVGSGQRRVIDGYLAA